MPEEYMTTEQACERLHMSRRTFWRRVADWGLQPYGVEGGRKRLWKVEDIEGKIKPIIPTKDEK